MGKIKYIIENKIKIFVTFYPFFFLFFSQVFTILANTDVCANAVQKMYYHRQ